MTSQSGDDLGHGVRVIPSERGGVVVLSDALELGWRPRSTDRRGSAVIWRGEGFEVASVEPWRRGARWTLEPWDGHDVMRVTLPLDPDSVAAAADRADRERAADRLRPYLWLLIPVLGFAAASWQKRWRQEWGYPAGLATVMTALGETVLGAACAIELMASIGSGASIFPWLPRPLVGVGVLLFAEGLFRLALFAADSEPVGSAAGVVVGALTPRRPAAPPPLEVPTVRVVEPNGDRIELVSPIQRRDLEADGVLPYHGRSYLLSRTGRLGESWVYNFERTAADAADRRLRLVPPRSRSIEPRRRSSPGVVRTVLLTVVTTLAPRRFQERWADEVGMNPVWLTVIGASAEVVGGLVNLRTVPAGDVLSVMLNLFFVGEGVTRLYSVAVRKEVMGSVLGWVLTPVLERAVPPPSARSST
ncbi:MAG: hypothetical protein PVG53_10075 [Holophagae bacterium]|jgi:hypothetical protein